jgi:RNA polymerase sigma factor (sigma-70 family)
VNPRLLPASRLARLSLRVQRDERLAELARLGSEAAFEAIVHRHRGALVRHCAQLVGDADAEEAVQDALLKAHRALVSGAEVHSLGAWLHAIAHNSALNLLRSRPAGGEYREHLDAGREEPGPRSEELDALVSAFLTLPVRQRRALVMRELEGRSYDEIAAELGASNGAVRQLLNRARASVRARLGALIPAELALRWITVAAGSGPSRAVALAGTGAFGAKVSSVILMSAAPVMAVAPVAPASGVTRVTRVTRVTGVPRVMRPKASAPAPTKHAVRVAHQAVAAVGGRAGVPAPGRQPTSSSATNCSTRPAMSSRVARTSSIGRPAGSGSSQSMYRLPGMYGHSSPQPIVTTTSAFSASSLVSRRGRRPDRSMPPSRIASTTAG